MAMWSAFPSPCTIELTSFKHFLLFSCLALVSLSRCSSSLCPALDAISSNTASSIYNHPMYFGYPRDIYGANSGSSNSISAYKCSSPEGKDLTTMHTCSTDYLCPVSKQNLEDAVVIDKLRRYVREENDEVLVVVIGGTVTLGANAGGCCCSEDIDPKCKGTTTNCGAQTNPKTSVGSCSWVGYFERFLSQLDARYKLINLAIHGSTSTSMATQIRHLLHTKGIQLSSKDIVIIDYSVEVQSIHSQDDVYSSTSGIEYLVRQILRSKYRSYTCPLIVLLETNPMHFSGQYRAICNRYGLTLWSIKSIALSEYVKENQPLAYPYLMFEKNYMYTKHYPPWHLHLYYADIISNLFLERFHRNVTIGAPIKFCTSTFPLSDTEFMACNHTVDPILSGDYTAHPPVGITPGRSRRYYWPHEESPPGEYSLLSMLEGSDSELQTLTFDIPASVLFMPNDQEILFLYTFRRTFMNAGVVQINLCDRWVAVADALWKNFVENHLSVSVTQYILFRVGDIRSYCEGEPPFIALEHYHHRGKSKEEDAARMLGQVFHLETVELCVANERLD